MINSFILLIIGLVFLIYGAEYTVRGSVAIANKIKIPTVIVGLTIVALGTSAPELVVSIKAALNGSAAIAVGNVVGSNIANILLILGLSSMIFPIKCRRRIFLRDYKFLLLSSILFVVFSLFGRIVCWQGIIFIITLLAFVYYNYLNSSKGDFGSEAISPIATKGWCIIILTTMLGLLGVVYGAHLLVQGAVKIAQYFKISEETIGLTIIAVGTSLPELATTFMAALRKQNGVALGNILGSNIWNIVFIIGTTSIITDIEISKQILLYDLWIMLLATLLLYPAIMTKAKISRFEGSLFFIIYVFYLISQILITKGMWVFAS